MRWRSTDRDQSVDYEGPVLSIADKSSDLRAKWLGGKAINLHTGPVSLLLESSGRSRVGVQAIGARSKALYRGSLHDHLMARTVGFLPMAGFVPIKTLYRVFVQLAGANADHLVHWRDENLTIADLSGMRCFGDGVEAGVSLGFRYHDFDFHLGQEVDDILRAAIELRVALLAPEALDLGGRHAGDADVRQRFAHVVELEGLYDGFDFFHRWRFLRPIRPVLTNHPFQARCRRQAGQAYHSPVAVPLPGECVCAYTE